jgi:hypothetical protein
MQSFCGLPDLNFDGTLHYLLKAMNNKIERLINARLTDLIETGCHGASLLHAIYVVESLRNHCYIRLAAGLALYNGDVNVIASNEAFGYYWVEQEGEFCDPSAVVNFGITGLREPPKELIEGYDCPRTHRRVDTIDPQDAVVFNSTLESYTIYNRHGFDHWFALWSRHAATSENEGIRRMYKLFKTRLA